MRMPRQFVFGYGSLAAELTFVPSRELRDDGFVAELPGFARGWGVAMDNRRDLPGYKYYTAADGSRPPVFVSFLDVAPTAAAAVNGLCLPVDDDRLAQLDRRERNYSRLDVSDRIEARGARVWVYAGTPAARERLRVARRDGLAVIDAIYLSAVERAFAALGANELALCRPSLASGDLPVVELVRNELA
jgi:Gamma-glutamyl cyclotransferase, AIG2-like